jgi:putative ABC transport system substrate-binding protein
MSQAQQPGKMYRIGFLSGGFRGPTHWTAKLRAELQKIGYVEGKNIVIDARYTENQIERLPGLADELVRLKPDVIVTGGINDARAAQNATQDNPHCWIRSWRPDCQQICRQSGAARRQSHGIHHHYG